MYEYKVFNDYDFDGVYCPGVEGSVSTGPMPPPCDSPIYNVASSATSSSITVTCNTNPAATCYLTYWRPAIYGDVPTSLPATPTGTSHTFTASNLSYGTQYAYTISFYCSDTYNWQGGVWGSQTTSSGGGGGGKYPKPQQPAIRRVWPNPAGSAANVRFSLPTESDVRVDVFDVHGRLVRNVARGRYPAGEHLVGWDGRTASGARSIAGVYFVRLRSAEYSSVQRLVLVSEN
jgi:hypothetical protein